MASIVYALSNPAMPGLLKIGRTDKDAGVRMSQLYSNPGVPLPFECVVAVETESPNVMVEKALHRAFHPQRVNPRREFFEIDPDQVVELIKLLGADVTDQVNADNAQLDESEKKAAEQAEKRSRRPNFNLRAMGIEEGSTLRYVDDDETTVEVVSDRQVQWDGRQVYLSEATQLARDVKYPLQPTRYWTFEGRLLSDIYEETYGPRA